MRNIWQLFVSDVKRMGGNTITVLVVLGLVLLPSLFSWYNLIACWDVFDHTGRLTVAVANSDEGYESDLMPLDLNIGEKLTSALRENDQLNWVFTNEDDAIEGTQSGRYYAAVVIPKDFSRNMMSFFESDAESATLIYYSNDKKSAIAPKVTDQGADQISSQVNRVFTETLSEVALALTSSLYDYAYEADVDGSVGKLAAHLAQVSSQLDRTAQTVDMYAQVVETAQALVDDSSALLSQAKDAANSVQKAAKDAKKASKNTSSSLKDALASLSTALDQSSEGFAAVPDSVNASFDSADSLASDAAEQLRNRASAVDTVASRFHELANDLAKLAAVMPEDTTFAMQVADLQRRMEAAATLQDNVRDSLNNAATDIEADSSASQETRAQVQQLVDEASASISAAKEEYESNLKPTLSKLTDTIDDAVSIIKGTGEKLDSVGSNMTGVASTLQNDMGDARTDLAQASKQLRKAADDVDGLGKDISTALTSGDSAKLREIIGSNPAAIASALSAPVEIERTAIYPVETFGSAMAPLYTTLGLWIGNLLMMVALRVFPSERTVRELDNPTSAQLFCGRFGVVALISLMQSTVMCLGNLLFVGVQAENPLLYLLCFWIAGLVFAFIIYTLVATFGNLGKALSVILLILQVSGGGGSFPMQLLPEPIQMISPYLPITHVVNAMRAAMFGVFNGDFWTEMGILLLFAVPFVLLGLVFRAPIVKVVNHFVEKVESSKVM